MDTTELARLSDALAATVAGAAARVVALHTKSNSTVSGILFRDGIALTADHAIHNHEIVAATLPDGAKIAASLAGRDPGSDLAVIRFAEPVPAPAWPDSPGAAAVPQAGHLVLAVGRSPEHGPLASMGVVSLAGSGSWRTWRGGSLASLIRLDIGLHPAMSGSLIVNAHGASIGLGTRGLSRLGAVVIPAATLHRVTDAVLTRGHVARGYLGLGLQPVPVPEHLMKQWNLSHSRALMVVSVEPDGPSEQAGLLLGDILVSINGQVLSDTSDVLAHLDGESAGRTLNLSLLRGGQRTDLVLTIGERSEKE